MRKLQILNLKIHNWRFNDFLEQLQQGVVYTPNIDHYAKLQKDKNFYDCYTKADHIVCDSRVIQLLSKFLYPGDGVVEQIAGSDLFPAFCQFHHNNTDKVRVFLLGGTKDSVVTARKNINTKTCSNIVVDGYSPPFGFENDELENKKILELVTNSNATVLAVGVGAPKQELWIEKHKHLLPNVKIFFAIGATIDFQAGHFKRAPKWMTKFGLEWCYRILQEPRRMTKRYLIDDLPFLWLVVKQKFGKYKNPWADYD